MEIAWNHWRGRTIAVFFYQTQQQPRMVHYQQVPGPPRQVATAQPFVARPGFTQVSLRSPQPATPGLPPGVGQPLHIASTTLRGKESPPKPSVSIAVVTSGNVLSWNMPLEDRHAPVMNTSCLRYRAVVPRRTLTSGRR